MKPHCSVIAINWNGASDTIEFIASLWGQEYEAFSLILLDNLSTDQSVDEIKQWLSHPAPVSGKFEFKKNLPGKIPFTEMTWSQAQQFSLNSEEDKKRVFLIRNEENLGFAKAVNRGIRFAQEKLTSSYFFLLNNDIFIDAQAIGKIIETAEQHPEYAVLQSMIFYYDAPQTIWNAGGRVLPWGQTRYYRKIPNKKIYQTYSISGCALLLRKETVESIGLLDERFFHGEEDLEYALRLKKHGKQAAVVVDSRIFHKVSIGANKQWQKKSERLINAALNRFLNMKKYFPHWFWTIWRLVTLFYYFLLLLFMYKESVKDSLKIVRILYEYSGRISEVSPRLLKEIQEKLR